jgi:hypothetical protein
VENPDIALIEEALKLADNDPSVLLRNLAIKIQEFEVNQVCDIKVKDVLNNICLTGKEIEEKIYVSFKFKGDMCTFNENNDSLEGSYERFMYIYDRKGIMPDIEIKLVEEGKKKVFFIDRKEAIEASNNEISIQKRAFSELKGVKDVNKKAVLDWMEQKIHECDLKNTTIPRLGMRHHRLVSKGLANVFRDLEEATKLANTLYPDKELDERFQEVFIELTTKKLQKHIGETVGKIIKLGNVKLTFVDENKMRKCTQKQ